MRILYVTAFYPPERSAGAKHAEAVATAWRAAGHDVGVLAHALLPERPGEPKPPRVSVAERDGVPVVRTWVWDARNRGVRRRLLSFVTFLLSAVVLGRSRTARPDVVVGASPHLFAALAGYVLARRWRVPFVLEVRELWPEDFLGATVDRERVIDPLFRRVSRKLYDGADVVAARAAGVADRISADYAVPRAKLHPPAEGSEPPARAEAIQAALDGLS